MDGCRTSAASRIKFFVRTVSSWESLAVVTKKDNSVPTGVLDPPLFEIEMGKLNKHHISEREFYYINLLLQLSWT